MKAIAVIGMNFGDEGKGHIVNFLSDVNTLNIRFNGGAQAAHAVFLSDGRNHIFKQLGAGSLQGARTLMASHMIINPIFLAAEWQNLSTKTNLREIFVDPRCRVSTVWDMLINEFSSFYKKKNDTTGFGINETVERSQFRQLRLCMRDLIDKDEHAIKKILETIRIEYVPWRIEQLGLPYLLFDKYCHDRINDIGQIEDLFIDTIKTILKYIVVWPGDNLIDRYLAKDKDRKLVFEGAQGFRLDQNRKKLMPYLTRSNTGLQNVFDCLTMVKTPLDLTVYLVTRSYLTRHGEGPLWNEVKKPYDNITENTNPENAYQGKMRYGYLNKTWYNQAVTEIEQYIQKTLPKCIKNIDINVAFTCLDQIDNHLIYSENGNRDFIEGNINNFQRVNIVSYGNKETDCRYLTK